MRSKDDGEEKERKKSVEEGETGWRERGGGGTE
jgi:hypothetical protein